MKKSGIWDITYGRTRDIQFLCDSSTIKWSYCGIRKKPAQDTEFLINLYIKLSNFVFNYQSFL